MLVIRYFFQKKYHTISYRSNLELMYTYDKMSNLELQPEFRRSKMSTIKGPITRHVITMNPNKVNAGEELYINIPKLKPDSCLVPNSLHLLFDFKSANTKSWVLNNLSRLLTKRLQIKLAGEVLYDNIDENLFGIYQDL